MIHVLIAQIAVNFYRGDVLSSKKLKLRLIQTPFLNPRKLNYFR